MEKNSTEPHGSLLSQEEIEKYFVRCDFDDECDKCNNPENGSYASGYTNDECGCEVDYYICGRCASEAIPGIIEREAKEQEYFDSLTDDDFDNLDFDEPDFQHCAECDLHDACEDFGCAYDLGLGHLVKPDNN